jgi:hypothetical protein
VLLIFQLPVLLVKLQLPQKVAVVVILENPEVTQEMVVLAVEEAGKVV